MSLPRGKVNPGSLLGQVLLSLVQFAAGCWGVRAGGSCSPAASSTVVLCLIPFSLTEVLYAVAPDGQLIMVSKLWWLWSRSM